MHLNIIFAIHRWAELREIADKKKETLELAHDINNWHVECQETMVGSTHMVPFFKTLQILKGHELFDKLRIIMNLQKHCFYLAKS